MPTAADPAAEVTAYLESLAEPARGRVEQVRAAVHEAVPGLGEKISYGVLTFTADGRTAMHTGGYAGHVSVYPVPGDPALVERCAPWVAGKGTLKFPHAGELPLDLVADCAVWFAGEARGRAARRSKG